MRFRTVNAAIVSLGLLAVLSPARGQMAEKVFKNVQVLKGIPADEFMNTMGVFSAALGMSCEDCHAANDAKWENYALDTSPKKLIARRMVQMMTRINKEEFGGRQMVTCFSCHRGADRPRVTPNLATLYTNPTDPYDIVDPAPNAPPADQIIDKYLQALGGAQRVAAITSFTAKGTSAGYGPESDKRPVDIYAKAPNQRTTIVHTLNGDSTTTFDGKAGWIAAPLRPIPVLPVSGASLDALQLEASLAFPAQIKQVLSKWRVGAPDTINDRDVQVVQGTGTGGAMVTFYFDAETGLLTRMVRYGASIVGRIPTMVDYSDYRDVSGVKMPFKWTVQWLDGKENFEMTEVRANVPIDAARFGRPAAPVAPK